MDKTTLQGKLEALLFLYGEPVGVRKLAEILDIKESELMDEIERFSGSLAEEHRGLYIIKSDGRVQLTTKPGLNPLLSKVAQEELDSGLTPASTETLSIVAYLGPCRRSIIEHIRGVNSSFILRSLMVRGLVERKPDPDRTTAFLYQVTFDFLRHMGVSKTDELPEYEKYREFTQLFINPTGGEVKTEEPEHEPNS